MGSTPNLNLYKGTPGSTTETFNVQTMMNDNWDKLDAYVQKKITVSDTMPLTPTDNELWLDISTIPNMLKRYDLATTSWIDIGAILATDISIQDTEGHFTADDVEGALHELFTNVSDGKTSIASAITDMGQAASGGDTFAILATKIRDISDDATALTGDVLSGKTFYQGGTKKAGTIPSRGVSTITPSTVNQTIVAGQYLSGVQTILGDPDLVSANIKSGANIFNVAGKLEVVDTTEAGAPASASQIRSGKVAFVNGAKLTGTLPVQATGAQNVTPGTTNIVKAAGIYDGDITILGDADLVSANIKAGANIFGVAGNANVVDTSPGTAVAGDVLSGKIAFVNGAKVTGTMANRGTVNITPSTVNQAIAGGYHSGSGVVYGDADLIAANIRSGKNIFGVNGSMIEGYDWQGSTYLHRVNLSPLGTLHLDVTGSGYVMATWHSSTTSNNERYILIDGALTGNGFVVGSSYGNNKLLLFRFNSRLQVYFSATTLTESDFLSYMLD